MALRPQLKHYSVMLLMFLVFGCTMLGKRHWDQMYGSPEPIEPQVTAPSEVDYYGQVRPLLEQRCVVCHGCYDAPCQLKLESFEGLLRGAHEDPVYDGTRLQGAQLTRLYEDAQSTSGWRDKGFYPVLNERNNNPEANLHGGVMARLLDLKRENPLPQQAVLPESFDFSINRDQSCPKIENFDSYAENNPLWGMPYGLPGLAQSEHQLLISWLAKGAPQGQPPKMNPSAEEQVAKWEKFFNGGSLKEQLVSRYLYEHLFLANLHFEQAPNTYFKLVRSHTPPGEPLVRISTRRPFDDPEVDRVYYRLWHDPSSIVAKLHLPYVLNDQRMEDWQRWFLEGGYEVKELPGYQPEIAANPFATFVDLPVRARYRFLLDEAEFTIMNFIKGPVCRGQVALNVIQDHFWVYFLNPEVGDEPQEADFFANNSEHLRLPAEMGNTLRPLSAWKRYSELQKEYLAAKTKYIKNKVEHNGALDLDLIWDGDGKNRNAALTIFRHSDSASVHRGLLGESPKTAWVIDYPLLERIHYLLVAGFDVYGNVSHQLLSRMYMDFLRMEGEMNFVSFLPESVRADTLEFWYRDAEDELAEYLGVYQNNLSLTVEHNIDYQTDQYQQELYQKIQDYLQSVLDQRHRLPEIESGQTQAALARIGALQGGKVQLLPQTTLIKVPELGIFTLVTNNAYSNLSSLFWEDLRRLPEEDTTTLAYGIVGAYPNSIVKVPEADLPAFAEQLNTLGSDQDYSALLDRYGIRRSHPDFWAISDRIHAWYVRNWPEEAALLDYNRLENR